jgi:rSAM/selenodomain-associated transferase 2
MDARMNTAAPRPRLSIIVPCLDEAEIIADALDSLAAFRARGAEVIVVDGGSSDSTPEVAASRSDLVLTGARGRAVQMNAGAAGARGDVLLFLHADTRLPENADALIFDHLRSARRAWGRFDVAIAGRSPLLCMVATLMNLRSRWTRIATGDQAIFVTRAAFAAAGGYPDIALMEDIALSKRLRKLGHPVCLTAKATTSGRRWETHGVVRTILLMWRLRFAYWMGADPDRLALRYAAHK